MKKGRHRRFEEARNLKRSWDAEPGAPIDTDFNDSIDQECDECGAPSGSPHASWCLAENTDDTLDEDTFKRSSVDKLL